MPAATIWQAKIELWIRFGYATSARELFLEQYVADHRHDF